MKKLGARFRLMRSVFRWRTNRPKAAAETETLPIEPPPIEQPVVQSRIRPVTTQSMVDSTAPPTASAAESRPRRPNPDDVRLNEPRRQKSEEEIKKMSPFSQALERHRQDRNSESAGERPNEGTRRCKNCGRSFSLSSHAGHERICVKVTANAEKRGIFKADRTAGSTISASANNAGAAGPSASAAPKRTGLLGGGAMRVPKAGNNRR